MALQLRASLVATHSLSTHILQPAIGQRVKIILVDKSRSTPTAKIVAKAIDEFKSAASRHSGPISYEVISAAECAKKIRAEKVVGTTALVSSDEASLSTRTSEDGGLRRQCLSLELAQALSRKNRAFVLRHSDTSPFSGVDVVAGVMCGFAGIIDDRELLRDNVLSCLTAHVSRDRRYASTLVIGRYATAVQELKAMLDLWNEDVEWDPTLDQSVWRSAMALAQLDELRPVRGAGDRYSFVKLAQGLNLLRARTSFQLSQSDLRKVLSRLATLWIKANSHETERVRLPSYARSNGFPQNQPVVSGIKDEDLPRRLYEAAMSCEVSPVANVDGVVQRLVRLPISFVNQVQRTR
jgi:hypothetical protein